MNRYSTWALSEMQYIMYYGNNDLTTSSWLAFVICALWKWNCIKLTTCTPSPGSQALVYLVCLKVAGHTSSIKISIYKSIPFYPLLLLNGCKQRYQTHSVYRKHKGHVSSASKINILDCYHKLAGLGLSCTRADSISCWLSAGSSPYWVGN